MNAALRLVLDSNVVLDLVVFRDPGVRRLRDAMACGVVQALGDDACIEELRHVLAYSRFGLDEHARDTAIQWYASRIIHAGNDGATSPLRVRKDPDDQKFLDLAFRAQASALVTKDLALLALARAARRQGLHEILSPTALDARLASICDQTPQAPFRP